MIFYFIFCFIIPLAWCFIFCDKRHIVRYFPLGVLIGYLINIIEEPFWKFGFAGHDTYINLFFNFGYFPAITILVIHLWDRQGKSVLFVAPFAFTFIEYVAVLFKVIIYEPAWNNFYTFLSYCLGIGILFIYVKLSEKITGC